VTAPFAVVRVYWRTAPSLSGLRFASDLGSGGPLEYAEVLRPALAVPGTPVKRQVAVAEFDDRLVSVGGEADLDGRGTARKRFAVEHPPREHDAVGRSTAT
jgi:hypothetical protein